MPEAMIPTSSEPKRQKFSQCTSKTPFIHTSTFISKPPSNQSTAKAWALGVARPINWERFVVVRVMYVRSNMVGIFKLANQSSQAVPIAVLPYSNFTSWQMFFLCTTGVIRLKILILMKHVAQVPNFENFADLYSTKVKKERMKAAKTRQRWEPEVC